MHPSNCPPFVFRMILTLVFIVGIANLGRTQAPSQTATTANDTSIEFLDLEAARSAIIDESAERYISDATDDFLRFCMGLEADAPIPKEAAARKQLATSTYQEMVRTFSQEEQELLSRVARKLSKLTAADWPLVSKTPWKFLKVSSKFCRGFAHTRGPNILLSPPMMGIIKSNEDFALTLLLHEKLHVLQRMYPERFEALYSEYGFRRIKLAEGELDRIRVAQNPDAFSIDWAVEIEGEWSLMVATFKELPDGKLMFSNERRELIKNDDGTYAVGDLLKDSPGFQNWKKSYGLEIGLEHPNEVSAYLSTPLLEQDYLSRGASTLPADRQQRIDATRKAFSGILGE